MSWMGKEFRGGCVSDSGQETGPAPFAGKTSPTLEAPAKGVGTGCWQLNCRPGASVAPSWASPLGPDTQGRGKEREMPRLGTRTGARPQAVAGRCSAPFRGSGYRRRRGRSAARQAGVPAGVPVGCRGPGRPRPAGPVPGATRARPRGHPCYYPAPRRGDPSAAAAPHRSGPPAWRRPGGGGEARQWRPRRGLRGSPSPPGPRRAGSAATATAASAPPARL